MTVFIRHCRADQDVADSLAKHFEKRGVFVETDDGAFEPRPFLAHDVSALLWSEALLADPEAARVLDSALSAAARGRLVLVALDASPFPERLHGLPIVPADAGRQATAVCADLDAAVRVLMGQNEAEAPQAPRRRARGGGGATGKAAAAALVLCVLAAAIFFAAQEGIIDPVYAQPAFLAAIAAGLASVLLALTALARRKSAAKP